MVLAYHSVSVPESDAQLLCVAPETFRRHMEYIRRHYLPVALGELLASAELLRFSKPVVAVTFDDGYADNFYHALLVLEHFEIPATVFIATGYIDAQGGFWWDELERLVLCPGRLPVEVVLTVGDMERRWWLDGHATFTWADFRRFKGWHVGMETCPTARHRLYLEVNRMLKDLPSVEREMVLVQLRGMADCSFIGSLFERRPLTRTELEKLASSDVITLGAHTVTHSRLPALGVEEQLWELTESKRFLEQITDGAIEQMAYPYGDAGSNNGSTVELVRRVGYRGAVTTSPSAVNLPVQDGERYRIARLVVRNWSVEEFASRLKKLLGE